MKPQFQISRVSLS